MEKIKLSIPERLRIGEENKVKGNEFFKNGDIQKAIKKYHFALMYLKDIEKASPLDEMAGINTKNEIGDKENAKLLSLRCQCYNNLAACFMKKKEYEKVINYSDKVLAEEPHNIKALFRRGESFFHLKDMNKAEIDFKKIKTVNSKETCADRYFPLIEVQKKRELQREKEIYMKMMKKNDT